MVETVLEGETKLVVRFREAATVEDSCSLAAVPLQVRLDDVVALYGTNFHPAHHVFLCHNV